VENLRGRVGVAGFGILSLVLAVALVTVVNRATGFNPFTLTVWSVIPAGAILTGAAATSGLPLGSQLFRTRPPQLKIVYVVTGAALAQAAVYYGEYASLVLENGFRVAERIGFFNYLDIRLTTAHLRLGPSQAGTGDVGIFGYWLALFQFAGFILGGLGTFILLKDRPACGSCSRHLRTLATGTQHFNDRDAFDTYYENVLSLPMEGPEFADWMTYDPDRKQVREGSILVTSTLRDCPCCHSQHLSQTIRIMGKKEWGSLSRLARDTAIPRDLDLTPVFRGEPSRAAMQDAA
jgi:hypothetical protein